MAAGIGVVRTETAFLPTAFVVVADISKVPVLSAHFNGSTFVSEEEWTTNALHPREGDVRAVHQCMCPG